MKKRGVDAAGYIWEECTLAEWDNLSDANREFVNFGDGVYVPARKVKE
jgi:hypothetical protein